MNPGFARVRRGLKRGSAPDDQAPARALACSLLPDRRIASPHMTASSDATFAGEVRTAASGKQVRVLVRCELAQRPSVRVLTLGPGPVATVGSHRPQACVANRHLCEPQASEEPPSAGASVTEVAAERPPGRRDPVRRRPVAGLGSQETLDQRRALARAQGGALPAERRFPTWPVGDDGRAPRLPDCFRTPTPSSALARPSSPAPSPGKTTTPRLRRDGGLCRLPLVMDECG